MKRVIIIAFIFLIGLTGASFAASRTLVASDNFNRASLGSDWTNLASYLGNMVIRSDTQVNGGEATGIGAIARWSGAGTFSDDQYASMKISGFSYQSCNYSIGVAARVSSDTYPNQDYYVAYVCMNSGGSPYTTKLSKVVNNSVTQLASDSVAWSAGDRLEIEAEGSTIRLLKNGTLVTGFEVTDTALTTGKPGIAGGAMGASTLALGDDWEAGDLEAAAAGQTAQAVIRKGVIRKGVLR